MFATLREYSLDVWDWLVGNQYPRQKQLDYLKRSHSLITADFKPEQELTRSLIKVDLRPEQWLAQSGIRADLRPEQELTQSGIRVDFKPEQRLVKLLRQPSLAGMWEDEVREWQDTHPESSVCITQEAKPRVLTAYTSEHEEF